MENKSVNEVACCVTQCERPLDQNYWNDQWVSNTTGWDIGYAAPAIVNYLKNVTNKNMAILIPGCGNAYEAEYLLKEGFTNITLIDIAPAAVEKLQQKFAHHKEVTVLCEDFFRHEAQYDLIIEQTFFCALPVTLRQRYVWKMHQLLKQKGKLIGLLFNKWFAYDRPPFGGSKEEYMKLFKDAFSWNDLDVTPFSITPRAGTELFIEMNKNITLEVNLYIFEGITCNGCMHKVTEKIVAIEGVHNVSMNANFTELIIVSEQKLPLEQLESLIAYDQQYRIVPFELTSF